MKHFGDITKLSGYDLPAVDVIAGGSPCQDLSVAGLRKGIKHSSLGNEETTRSGLFMEFVRIVKEMRDASRKTNQYVRPRFMVFENVPGLLSSGEPKGEDFRIVLTEIVRIAEPDAPSVPLFGGGGTETVDKIRMPLRCTGQMEHCLESTRCAVLGSCPAKETYRSYR